MTTIDIKLFTMANTLLLLSGDVELNPGPPGRREPKPDPKKIMEEKVNNHDEKLKMLEELVMEQKKMLEEMGGKQVELEGQISENKVELERAAEENKRTTDEAVADIRDHISTIQDGLKGGLSQLGSQTSGTDNKLRSLENSLDEVQDKLWELDKSWENNLVFYGIREDAGSGEETSQIMEAKIKEIVKNRLGIGREIPIFRVKRSYTGSNVRGSKPVTVYFQKYSDKEEILRKAKLLAGSNIYVTEDFSKRVKDKRIELQKFMKKMKRKQPASRFHLRYDKLLVDKEVYVFNENTGLVELQPTKGDEYDNSRSSPTTPFRSLRGKSSGRKKLEKSFSTDSALNHLGGSVSDLDSRDPSPTKSMSPPLEDHIEMYLDGKSRPASPKEEPKTDGESEDDHDQAAAGAAAANYTNLNTFNGNLRKSNPDIPETIAEDE